MNMDNQAHTALPPVLQTMHLRYSSARLGTAPNHLFAFFFGLASAASEAAPAAAACCRSDCMREG